MPRTLIAAGLVCIMVHSPWNPTFAQQPHERAERVVVSVTQTAAETPPLGCNAFGDPGGTCYSAGNLILDGGCEPMSIRKRVRVNESGIENGIPWFSIGGSGMSYWDLTSGGYLSGADVRAYGFPMIPLHMILSYLRGSCRSPIWRLMGLSPILAARPPGVKARPSVSSNSHFGRKTA